MFAALYAPSVPTAALIDVARNFTPRFEQVGSVVLLDASGLSRLLGSPQELGDHLRDALSKLSPGDTIPRIAIASTQTAAGRMEQIREGSENAARMSQNGSRRLHFGEQARPVQSGMPASTQL